MHKHSEPEKEELKFKQIPTDLFEQKIAKRFFCVRFFNIPYQVCLTGDNREWKISPILDGGKIP